MIEYDVFGGMRERSNRLAWRAMQGVIPTRVQIPLPPPIRKARPL